MVEQRPPRRLAAILAADVVGYSRLMEEDEPGTLATLKARRKSVLEPLIVKYGGRIFKVAGDGVLVEFSSAVGAVQCAIELQEQMATANSGAAGDRQIVLRIGINLGDVMVEGGDLYGDGVNVAARLEAKAEAGGICISEDAYRQVRGKLKVAFEDLGEQALKNIALPLRVYRIAGAATAVTAPARATTEKPAIVILPFANMSEDPDKQYLSDGITEDIITELSRYSSLLVIARNSACQFRGDNFDIAAVRRKLGVRFVVEGSVRKIAARLRITAQLIDAATEAHMWADRFDRDIADVFEVQDEIARSVAAIIEGRVSAAGIDRLRHKPTSDWVAYDYFLQGRDHVNHSRMTEAEPLLAEAVKLDPNYAHAHAFRAIGLAMDGWLHPEQLDRALVFAQRALALDENDPWSHQAMGYVYLETGRLDLAGPHFERAITLNPNDTGIVAERANWLMYSGRLDEALQCLEVAMGRDPHPPNWVWGVRGMVLFHLQRYEDAIAALLHWNDPRSWPSMQLAAAYAQAGRIDQARREVARILENEPSAAAISIFTRGMAYTDPAHRAQLIEGLRKAGLPE